MPFTLHLALAVAASTGLYATALLLAPAAAPLVLLVPLPGLLLASRGPAAVSVLWFVLTTLAVSVIVGPDAAPGFVLPLGLPALVLVVGIRRFWSLERTAVAGVGAWTLGIGALALLAYGDLATLTTTLREQVSQSIEQVFATYSSLGSADSALSIGPAERESIVTGLVETLPALVVLSGAFTVLVNLLLARQWTTTLLHSPNLRLWRAPDELIWVLIAAGFAMFIPASVPALVARNVFIVILGCYFCQGLAIVSYYLERFRLPRGLRIAGFVLIAVQHVLTAMVLVLGVFDLWGNFRRLNAGPADVPFHSDGD